VSIVRLLVIALVMIFPAVGLACEDFPPVNGSVTTSMTDPYEPNDSLETATPLVPGTALGAYIARGGSPGDLDLFRCDVPESAQPTPFRVEVASTHPEYLEVQAAASIPDAFEAISWPGWKANREGDSIVVHGELRAGTVLVFISGTQKVDYSVRIVWE
jgi:hypothetical protein